VRKTTKTLLAVLGMTIGVLTVPATAAQAAPASAAAVAAPVQAQTALLVAAAPKKKTVALTFDDGPGDYTYQVLDVLKKYKVKATFCVIGNQVPDFPNTMKRIVDEGHRLCNHSQTHADLTKGSTAKVKRELTGCQVAVKDSTKVTMSVVRFPYGASNATVRKVAKGMKLRALGWDVDPEDWRNPPAKKITERIVKATTPGDVVLLHDGGGVRRQTVNSLAGTITQLKKKGYTFVLA
jgi:peptidoglycan/xylan/chitin deacetylase (PgdA/CDA1 family)